MRKRIIESIDKFNNEEDMVEYLMELIDKDNKCEFGTIGYHIYDTNSITFSFDPEYHDVIEWGEKNITNDFVVNRTNISPLKSKIVVSKDRRSGERHYILPIEFSMLKGGKRPILILHMSEVFRGHGDETIVLREGVKISEAICENLESVFAWLKLCKKLHDFDKLDEETLRDLFSDAFDDAEDYAIAVVSAPPIKSYEIAISTKTKREGGYIDIDDDVMRLLNDIANIKSHLSEYDVKVAFNTTRPNKDKFPDKNSTFYQSQAIIIRIIPS